MKNPVDYFEKIIQILKELRLAYPKMTLSQHITLATCDEGDFIPDKTLYSCLLEHQSDLELIEDLKDFDIEKETEEIFKEIDPEDEEEY